MLLPAVGSNWVGTNALTDSDEKELIGGLLSLMAWLREWHPAVPIIFPWVDAMVLFGSELTEVSHRAGWDTLTALFQPSTACVLHDSP